MRRIAYLSSVLALAAAACSDDSGGSLFPEKPECAGDSIVAYQGSNPVVISHLEIGKPEDGFDLDHDGKPDNKLGSVAGIAKSAIDDSFDQYSIVIPIEFFDLPAAAADTCVKFAIYLGAYDLPDADGDGKKDKVEDCNDHDMAIPGGEVADGKDNDCDGLADEDEMNHPSMDTADADHDGQTIKDGDCDDTNAMVKKGLPENCTDGLDNDCDGRADRTKDSFACGPFANDAEIPLDPLSFEGTEPVIAFDSGTITEVEGKLQLEAGPSVFAVSIPVYDGVNLTLKITGATIKGDVVTENGKVAIKNGHLGGVIDAKTADTIRGLKVDQIGLLPEDSLLDATFANILGSLLALPKAKPNVLAKYPSCRTPDIDVDRDGLEAYCESDDTRADHFVDICIDGDGTEVTDMDAGGTVVHCTEAQSGGRDRFVDGISVELNFDTSSIAKIKPKS